MTERLRARHPKDVENAVQWALGEGRSLEILGHGSKRTIGRPPLTDLTLDLSALLRASTLYEPAELVLSARAGTALSEIEALVAAQGQRLAFEPMDCGQLLGGPTGRRHHRGHHRGKSVRPRAGSRPAPRATICSALWRCPGAARPSGRAAGS